MEYKTQMEAAKKGIVTKELSVVAQKEGYTGKNFFLWWRQGG